MTVSCSVKGCRNNSDMSRMHRLPKDDVLLKLWLQRIGRMELLAKPKLMLYDNHRICTAHFHPSEFVTNIRKQIVVRAGVIPSLSLRMNVAVQDVQEVPSNSAGMDIQGPMTPNPDNTQEQGPSCSYVQEVPSNSAGMNIQGPMTPNPDITGSSFTEDQGPSCSYVQEAVEVPNNTQNQKDPKTPTATTPCKKRNRVLAVSGKRKLNHLSPDAKEFFKIGNELNRKVRRLDVKNKGLKLSSNLY